MQRLQELSSKIFPSKPSIGKIGSVELNVWLAQIVGVPLLGLKDESKSLKCLLLAYGIVMTTLITFIYTGFEIYDLYLHMDSLDIVTQNTCLSLTHVAGVFKSINGFYRIYDIKNVVEKIKYAAKKYIITEKQHKAFFSGEFENKMPLTIYASLVGFTGFLGIGMLFYNPEGVGGEIFPYRVVLPQWMPNFMQLAYMGISVLVFALQIVAVDYLNVTFINQIRFQLTILHLTFDDLIFDVEQAGKALLNGNAERKQHEKISIVEPYGRLKGIIEHHCLLIDLRNQVEDIFRFPVLLQFFTSLVIFGLTGFQAIVRTGDINGAMLIYCYCGCIFVELFVYCWFGNSVFEQSKTLATSGYSSSWYQFDQHFRKSLIIFMMNAQRPFLFTAGGFMGLSLPSFAGILSKSYSFIALLRQVYSR